MIPHIRHTTTNTFGTDSEWIARRRDSIPAKAAKSTGYIQGAYTLTCRRTLPLNSHPRARPAVAAYRMAAFVAESLPRFADPRAGIGWISRRRQPAPATAMTKTLGSRRSQAKPAWRLSALR